MSRTNLLSAVYVPAYGEVPRELIADTLQVVVGLAPPPTVRIVPPSRHRTPAVRHHDQLILAVASPDGEKPSETLYAQEASDPYLFSIGHAIQCGFRLGCPPPEVYLESLATPVAEHIRAHYPVRIRHRERHGLAPSRLWRALALVEERFDRPLAVEEIAAEVHLSPFHFARMFRRSTGTSPHAFITRRRLEKAKMLLATTDLAIGEIARVVGYRTQAHFTRVFHANEGTTPRRYRSARWAESATNGA